MQVLHMETGLLHGRPLFTAFYCDGHLHWVHTKCWTDSDIGRWIFHPNFTKRNTYCNGLEGKWICPEEATKVQR